MTTIHGDGGQVIEFDAADYRCGHTGATPAGCSSAFPGNECAGCPVLLPLGSASVMSSTVQARIDEEMREDRAARRARKTLKLAAEPGPASAKGAPDLKKATEAQLVYLQARQAATEQLAAAQQVPIPAFTSVADLLQQADEEPQFLVDQLWPEDGNVVLAAQFKAGKTTLRDNLVRSWCDGDPFLGRFAIRPAGLLMVLDAEMPESKARTWLLKQGIEQPQQAVFASLRGQVSSFAITVPRIRRDWAKRLADEGIGCLILDCIGPVLAVLGLDENRAQDAGRFLAEFEQMMADAGITSSLVIHHMGHGDERSRGASRLRDWPDAEWRLVRKDPDDPGSERYLAAYGRDVEVHEGKLGFDAKTHHLRFEGGSRTGEADDVAREAIVDLLTANGGLSGNQIEKQLDGTAEQKAIRRQLKELIHTGRIDVLPGPRNSKIHHIAGKKKTSSSPRQDPADEPTK